MNGRLHLGHAFSLTKAEFAAGFKRLQGYNVLFPFGFHCTGMPIQAAANKLKDELETFGNPPQFPDSSVDQVSKKVEEVSVEKQVAALAKKGKAKKAKVASKSAGTSYQWKAMEKMGLDPTEIAEFADPNKWLQYFPPLGVTDLEMFGASIDWRRSFITTELNAYYDSFVRWQFSKLKAGERISYGKRANVYSVRDGQVCADHDRATGEGVGPQEYVLIKLKMVDNPLPGPLSKLTGRDVYLVPATLRPETMYGQTNCYVLPDGKYGAYEQANGDVFVCSRRSAVGLAHQGSFDSDNVYSAYASKPGEVVELATLSGWDILGAALKAPLATFEKVYTLPLTTISMTKGTGVVTSVPSDAPDDWIALKELKDQPELREKYKLSEEMVVPFNVIPIINVTVEKTDNSGGEGWSSDVAAEYWCEKLDIKSSQKDAAKLKQAKGETYLHGFNSGVMLVGKYAGKKVSEAKPLVKQDMVAAGDALLYFEPESPVVSRSGDDCIVAHTEQWYLKYGEERWRAAVEAHVLDGPFEAYNSENLGRFKHTLGWMKEWACSRLFGLGTKIPWDQQWVIESLSDSTIYMAYYTVAHVLHGAGNLDGSSTDLEGTKRRRIVPADQMTEAAWDYIFFDTAAAPSNEQLSSESLEALSEMRREFQYWYPLDLRVSGKDLIGNHLTMCLYNHAAVWPERPDLWPRSMYCNGFVLLDGEKMSKSTGNFLMLEEACRMYSTDGVRFALADAGDTLEDANFERKRADAAVVMLFVEEEFAQKVCGGEMELRDGDRNFMDIAFDNELNALANQTTQHFEAMRWRDGAVSGAFGLQLARDAYRDWCYRTMIPMHADLARKYVELSAVLIAPICPHFAEHVWGRVLKSSSAFGGKGPGTLRSKVWPEELPVDKGVSRAFNFLRKASRTLRLDVIKDSKNKPVANAYIYVASTYPDWKRETLAFMRDKWPMEKKALLGALKSDPNADKKKIKDVMQFAAFMYDYAIEIGADALEETLPFDQCQVLNDSKDYLQNSLNPQGKIENLVIYDLSAAGPPPPGPDKKKNMAGPGAPTIHVFNE